MEQEEIGRGSALGLSLGLTGIVTAISIGFLSGFIGGGISLMLGIAAIVLGSRTGKRNKGRGAVFTGIMSIILAMLMTGLSIGDMKRMYQNSLKMAQAYLIQEYGQNPYFGIVGLLWNTKENGDNLDRLNEEMKTLNDVILQ